MFPVNPVAFHVALRSNLAGDLDAEARDFTELMRAS